MKAQKNNSNTSQRPAALKQADDIRSYQMIARAFDGKPEGLSRDDLLDNITFYWLTNPHTLHGCGIGGCYHSTFSVGEDHDRFVRTEEGWRFVSRRWIELFARGDVLNFAKSDV